MKTSERYITLNGLDIYVKQIGDGEPIVFLHGGPGIEHRAFLPHVTPLSEYFTLYFYDQPGCGLSQKADKYTIEQEIDILDKLRSSLGIEKLNLVGESWGTVLALLYATTYPKRVEKLLLSSAIGAAKEGFLRFGQELADRLTPEDKHSLSTVEDKLSLGQASVQDVFSLLARRNEFPLFAINSINAESRGSLWFEPEGWLRRF